MAWSRPLFNSPATTQASTVFGAVTNSPFGRLPTSGPTATGIFGVNQTGTTIKFAAKVVRMSEYLASSKSVETYEGRFQSISAMKEYETKSLDELRMEDYLSNRKFPPATAMPTWAAPRNPFGFPTPVTTTAPANPFVFPAPVTAIAPTNPFGFPKPVTTTAPANPFVFPAPVTAVAPATQFLFTTPVTTTAPANPFVFPAPVAAIAPTNPFGFPKPVTTTAPANTFTFPPTTAAAPIFKFATTTNPTTTTANEGTMLGPKTDLFPPPPTTTTSASTIVGFLTTSVASMPTTSTTTVSGLQADKQPRAMSAVHQQFLAASLLDPYANRGKKEFTDLNVIAMPNELTRESAAPTTTAPTPQLPSVPSTAIPAVLPLHSNYGKAPLSRSAIDVNFKLKPVSHEEPQPSHAQPTSSNEPKRSTLSQGFTDEEEIILLGRTGFSKLRLSHDILDSPPTGHSLYPARRLAELEKLTNLTPPTTPTRPIAVKKEPVAPTDPIPPPPPKTEQPPATFSPPKLTGKRYYMKPNAAELQSSGNRQGQCLVQQFTVGHEQHGSVTFYGQVDVSGLDLDSIIQINQHEVIVYPDDTNKPPVGEQLNRPARITLLGVYPIDRTTGEEIRDVQRIEAMNYRDHLTETTKKFDGEFVRYDPRNGSWTFMVKHFTRYGLDPDQTDALRPTLT